MCTSESALSTSRIINLHFTSEPRWKRSSMSSMASISKSLELSLLEFLPPEVLAIISRDLSNVTSKTCDWHQGPWGAKLALQLDRVFISANPQHVEVFRTITDHEVYRYQVAEIVWDDTQLPHDVKLTGLQSCEVRLRNWGCSTYMIPDWYLYRCNLDKIVPRQGSLEEKLVYL